MKKLYLMVISAMIINLVGCNTITPTKPVSQAKEPAVIASSSSELDTPTIQDMPPLPAPSDPDIGGTFIGGAVEQAMDEADKSKMLHAMDKAPGKSTHWSNVNTQITYTVTPTKKIRIEDKNYCRQYKMTAVDANQREQYVEGVACIAADGNWHTVRT